jgi:hypothetical protein
LYDEFFEITVTLCNRFTGFDPVKVRQYPAQEIFLLLKRLVKYDERHAKHKRSSGNGVIRKQAGDDWF